MVEFKVGFADKDRITPAKVGDTIIITLQENATTGFQWKMTSFTSDTLEFDIMDSTSAPSGSLGAGGGEVFFRLKAIATGPGKVNLKLSRGTRVDSDSDFGFELNFDIS